MYCDTWHHIELTFSASKLHIKRNSGWTQVTCESFGDLTDIVRNSRCDYFAGQQFKYAAGVLCVCVCVCRQDDLDHARRKLTAQGWSKSSIPPKRELYIRSAYRVFSICTSNEKTVTSLEATWVKSHPGFRAVHTLMYRDCRFSRPSALFYKHKVRSRRPSGQSSRRCG